MSIQFDNIIRTILGKPVTIFSLVLNTESTSLAGESQYVA
jgi:hypothetical protein